MSNWERQARALLEMGATQVASDLLESALDEVDALREQLKEATNTPAEHHFAAGKDVERASIVRWLNSLGIAGRVPGWLAQYIERGEHRKKEEP